MPDRSPLVSTAWLAEHLGDKDVVVVDASFHLPAAKRDAKAEYLADHIPGAVFFDIDAIADHSTDLPHMLPGPTQFAAEVGKLGIGKDDTIVVYDAGTLSGSARAWWTFRLFGARKVFVLDGGLPQWKADGHKTESGDVKRDARDFPAEMNTRAVANAEEVNLALISRDAQVVDARAADRFRGEAPEPRPGLRSGHMPGARNVPVGTVAKNGHMAKPDEVRRLFEDAGVDLDKPVITTCGSGVTAATLWLALETIGKPPRALYDGS
ncbi:MAG: 3-mercaptopyruvate sulfurtransferase, partial [Rhizobiales bacterium]|nr:3-mercaptopyruvate sulfurtransferase [Hyphomicrobiales bacterium]